MEKVTGEQIISEIESRIKVIKENEDLTITVGSLNGLDMPTYRLGYLDALIHLKSFFETRV